MTDIPAVVYLKAEVQSTVEEDHISKTEDSSCETKSSKKFKSCKVSVRSRKKQERYKMLLEVFNKVVLKKLDKIEGSLDILSDNCDVLEDKVNSLSYYLSYDSSMQATPGIMKSTETPYIYGTPAVPFSSRITYITLNSEDDFPDGSWLGFENNPEMRVRCKIPPSVLKEISERYSTPEKMALTLLDYLFDRETQACSNVSGLGKHRKKQLDPLLIYGIKCHLIYRFDINEDEWTKVKIHIDSKCRTAFRRKRKGMPLNPRKNTSSTEPYYLDFISGDFKCSVSSTDQEFSLDDSSLPATNSNAKRKRNKGVTKHEN